MSSESKKLSLKDSETSTLSLSELLAKANEVLGEEERLDERTFRYYGTLKVIDAPFKVKGRAFYGARHLLQVLAVKRLQKEENLTLTSIRARLLNRPNAQLQRYAQADEKVIRGLREDDTPNPRTWEKHARSIMRQQATVLTLAPGVTLTVEDSLTDDDIDNITSAALALVAALPQRRSFK